MQMVPPVQRHLKRLQRLQIRWRGDRHAPQISVELKSTLCIVLAVRNDLMVIWYMTACLSLQEGGGALSVASHLDCSQYGTLVDVGGASGSLLAEVLERHPRLHGILFDLPQVRTHRLLLLFNNSSILFDLAPKR